MDRRVSATCHTASLRLTKIVAIHAESFQRFSLLFVPSHGRTRQGIDHRTATPHCPRTTHGTTQYPPERGRAAGTGARCTLHLQSVRASDTHTSNITQQARSARDPAVIKALDQRCAGEGCSEVSHGHESTGGARGSVGCGRGCVVLRRRHDAHTTILHNQLTCGKSNYDGSVRLPRPRSVVKIVVIHAESSNQFALCTFLSSCRQRGILHVRDGVSEPRP